ncbi:MAG: hypothetical protein JOY71_11980 [Acetobacteraceae bacterium]|nr:hypothetical protein [Acetobacteraceae bacterium]
MQLDQMETEPSGRAITAERGRWTTPSRPLRIQLRLWPAVLPFAVLLPVVLAPPANHDAAAVLDFSQRWLAGEPLYDRLVDVNPPLIFILNLIPAAIARVTPLGAIPALQLCLLGWGLFCWVLSFRARERRIEGRAERTFLDVLPGLFLLGAGYDFGQREHLMAIAALPYVFSAAQRSQGRQSSVPVRIGLNAAIGLALKPYFLALAGLVEIAVLAGRFQASGFRAGLHQALADRIPLVMLLAWATYLASVPLLFPAYFTFVIPLAWTLYIGLGGLSPVQLLLMPRMALAASLLLPLAATAFLPGDRALPRMLGLAGLGALIAALVQHKGYSYHILPVELFGCALVTVILAQVSDRARGRIPGLGHVPPAWAAAGLAFLFALYSPAVGEAPWRELGYRRSPAEGLAALLERQASGQKVLVLSPGVYPIYPALNYAGAHPTLRTMNLWILQGVYAQCLPNGERYREGAAMGAAERSVFQGVAEDFAAAPPAVVIVDKQPGIPWCGQEFNFIAYFTRNPQFAAVWKRYRLTNDYDRYRIYTLRQ